MTFRTFILFACLSLTSCESMWGWAYHKRGGFGAVQLTQPVLVPIKHKSLERYQNASEWPVTANGVDEKVPKGLVVDGASVPRLCWFFMPPDGLHRAAALFHDWVYLHQGHLPTGTVMTRLEADQAFYNLMVQCGVGETRAGIAYRGVRLGGKSAWDSIEEPLILPVQPMTFSAKKKSRTPLSHIYAQ